MIPHRMYIWNEIIMYCMSLYCIEEYHTITNVLLHIIMLHHNVIYHMMSYYMGNRFNRAAKSRQNEPQNESNFGSEMGLKRAQNGFPRPDSSSAPIFKQNQQFSIGFKGKTRNLSGKKDGKRIDCVRRSCMS